MADAELNALERWLAERSDRFETELQMGILTLEFPDGVRYVVNSHRAARQIWMAAERAAWHFDPQIEAGGQVRWVSAKTQEELRGTLDRVVRAKLG